MPAPPQRPLTAADHLEDVADHVDGRAAELTRDADTIVARAGEYPGRVDLPRMAQSYRERVQDLEDIARWVRGKARLIRLHDEAGTVRTVRPRRWWRWPW